MKNLKKEIILSEKKTRVDNSTVNFTYQLFFNIRKFICKDNFQ